MNSQDESDGSPIVPMHDPVFVAVSVFNALVMKQGEGQKLSRLEQIAYDQSCNTLTTQMRVVHLNYARLVSEMEEKNKDSSHG